MGGQRDEFDRVDRYFGLWFLLEGEVELALFDCIVEHMS